MNVNVNVDSVLRVYDDTRSAACLLVAFSSLGGGAGGVSHHEFVKSSQRAGATHALFFRDLKSAWFLLGLGDDGSFEDVVAILDKEVESLQPKGIVLVGASMGGYAAIRAGLALSHRVPTVILAFAPQIVIEPQDRSVLGLPAMPFDANLHVLKAAWSARHAGRLPTALEPWDQGRHTARILADSARESWRRTLVTADTAWRDPRVQRRVGQAQQAANLGVCEGVREGVREGVQHSVHSAQVHSAQVPPLAQRIAEEPGTCDAKCDARALVIHVHVGTLSAADVLEAQHLEEAIHASTSHARRVQIHTHLHEELGHALARDLRDMMELEGLLEEAMALASAVGADASADDTRDSTVPG